MSTFLVKVSNDEIEFRSKSFNADLKNVLSSKQTTTCTSCQDSIKADVVKRCARLHPVLATLICQKCEKFYGQPEDFSVDEDGNDKYCRWCGQGGNIYECSKCPRVFCRKCVKRNLPRSEVEAVEQDNWVCYCCNSKPIWELRAAAAVVNRYQTLTKKKGKQKNHDSDDDYRAPGEKKSKHGKSTATPLLRHVASIQKVFVKHFEQTFSDCESYCQKAGEIKSMVRREVTSKDAAQNYFQDAVEMSSVLIKQLQASTKKLELYADDWMYEYDKLEKEEEVSEKEEPLNEEVSTKKNKGKKSLIHFKEHTSNDEKENYLKDSSTPKKPSKIKRSENYSDSENEKATLKTPLSKRKISYQKLKSPPKKRYCGESGSEEETSS